MTTTPEHYATVEPVTGHFRVLYGEQVLAEADQVLRLQETYQGTTYPEVYYFRPEDVERTRLIPNPKHSRCPIKGLADYWDVQLSDGILEAAVWGYPEPREMVAPIAGHLAFDTSQGIEIQAQVD